MTNLVKKKARFHQSFYFSSLEAPKIWQSKWSIYLTQKSSNTALLGHLVIQFQISFFLSEWKWRKKNIRQILICGSKFVLLWWSVDLFMMIESSCKKTQLIIIQIALFSHYCRVRSALLNAKTQMLSEKEIQILCSIWFASRPPTTLHLYRLFFLEHEFYLIFQGPNCGFKG
mgnify:CR=1 FL=1